MYELVLSFFLQSNFSCGAVPPPPEDLPQVRRPRPDGRLPAMPEPVVERYQDQVRQGSRQQVTGGAVGQQAPGVRAGAPVEAEQEDAEGDAGDEVVDGSGAVEEDGVAGVGAQWTLEKKVKACLTVLNSVNQVTTIPRFCRNLPRIPLFSFLPCPLLLPRPHRRWWKGA